MKILRDTNAARRILLREIASIQTGFSFRNGLNIGPAGALVLQIKDIASDGNVKMDGISRIPDATVKDMHFIREGDIVFRSRGNFLNSGVFPATEERVILSAPLTKITPDKNAALPEYLVWHINGRAGQAYIAGIAEGTAVKMVSIPSLGGMPIALPPLELQRSICDALILQKKEKLLATLIMEKRELLLDMTISRALEYKGD